MQATTMSMASISQLIAATTFSLSPCPRPLYIPKTRISVSGPAYPSIITRISVGGKENMRDFSHLIFNHPSSSTADVDTQYGSSSVRDTTVEYPIRLAENRTVTVERPRGSGSRGKKKQEKLVVHGIRLHQNVRVTFHVRIMPQGMASCRLGNGEYVGTYDYDPSKGEEAEEVKSFVLTKQLIKKLNVKEEGTSVEVTFEPTEGRGMVEIAGVSIQ